MVRNESANPVTLIFSTLEKSLKRSVLFQFLFLFLFWLLVWQVGRVVEYTEHASVWFPASGFTFSCLFVLGRRALLPIMAAAIVTTIWNGNHYNLPLNLQQLAWGGFLFGLAHIIPYWLGAACIARMANNKDHSVPRLIVVFILIAGLSALLTTVMVLSSLVISQQMPIDEVRKTVLPFWVGDMAGVIVLAPLFSAILIRIFPNSNVDLSDFADNEVISYKQVAGKLGLNIVLILLTMFLAYFTGSFESSFAIFFLAVTHMWIATTETPLFNIISLAISSTLIVLLTHYLGLMDFVMVYQFAINVVAANSLFGIAIPQMKADNLQLQSLVFTDTLTNVSSRRHMVERAEQEIKESEKLNHSLILAVFDLDKFKSINDTWGHSAGDQALIQVCREVNKLLRKRDVFARFGGDEFVILMPEITIQDAQSVIESIREKIESIKIQNIFLSSSFGIAQLQKDEDFKSLFHRADQALYASKESGRNRITLAS